MNPNNKTFGILSNIGRKLDKDVELIFETLRETNQRLEAIEQRLDKLTGDKENPASYSVDYSTEGAWTSTVLFKEEEETTED